MAVLTSSRYIEPGAYVGEIINPEASNLSADARVMAIIAKGSRLAVAANVPIIRSFITGEQLNFSSVPPYIAPLQHSAKGEKLPPNVLYKQDGTEFRPDEWNYIQVSGEYRQIQLRDESFDPTATYYLSYQSNDRNVLDPIPVNQLRQIRLLGNQIDRDQYREYRDYFIPMSFSAPDADVDNAETLSFFSAVTATLQPGSTGSVAVDASADYSHAYNRQYQLECVAITGSAPNRTATFEWSAKNLSGGNVSAPPVPLHAVEANPQIVIQESTPASMQPTLEFGVTLDLSFGGANFVVGDLFSVDANGAGLVELDARYNSAQFAKIQNPVLQAGTTGDLSMQANPDAMYSNARNHRYTIKLVGITGSAPNRQLTFAWARHGDTVIPQAGTFTVLENNFSTHTQALSDGVKVDFIVGATNASIGATWQMSATAPRIYYTAKDSRSYKLTIGSVVNPAANTTLITGGFSTDTTEGRFGNFETTFLSTGAAAQAGYAVLPDNVSLAFRNMTSSYAAQDIFTFGVVNEEVLQWNLEAQGTDVRQLTDFNTDLNGSITGTAGLKYVILSQIPTDVNSIRVVDANTNQSISFNYRLETPFLYFSADPGVPVRITYTYRGAEPDPGQAYFLTASFLRPDEYYNAPFLVLRLEDGRKFAAPAGIDNDLYIGNEIAWDNNAPAAYLLQPKNQDGSGVYSRPDFADAIRAVRDYDRITDLCLLNYPNSLEDVLNENLLGNDPFERRPNLVWAGAPIATPIGDENVEGSLVYLARRTLQVRGDSAAKGTRILVGSTKAKKTIRLDNNSTTQVTLDGSFVALAACARVNGFSDPATDLLRTQVNGFDEIEVYRDEENALLGQAQIVYIKGAPGSYFWAEDTTVDTTKSFERIQLMTQRQFVVKVVVREMETLIGITPASGQAGRELVRGQLSSILRGLLAKGLIAPYQDKDGNERAFDPNKDIVVFQDKNDLSTYYFNFAWFSRNVIKRLLGLYALNSNDFSTGVPLR